MRVLIFFHFSLSITNSNFSITHVQTTKKHICMYNMYMMAYCIQQYKWSLATFSFTFLTHTHSLSLCQVLLLLLLVSLWKFHSNYTNTQIFSAGRTTTKESNIQTQIRTHTPRETGRQAHTKNG